METEPYLFEEKNKIGILALNRPDVLNAIDITTMRLLNKKVDEIADNSKLKILIITGKGRAFSAGNDLKAKMTPDEAWELQKLGRTVCLKILYLPQITVAAVNGYAMGGGFEIAISTDLRVASENATFGLPESKIGFPVAWGGWLLLPKLVGVTVAKEIMFFGDKFGVDKAVQLGLVNKVLPSENFMKHVMDYAKELKKRDASLMQITKYMINRSLEDPLSKTNHMAQKMFGIFSDEGKKEKLAKLRKEMLNELLD